MKTIIAGGRSLSDPKLIKFAVNSAVDKANIWPREIVVGRGPFTEEEKRKGHGALRGIDSLALAWALEQGIHPKHFPPDWDKYGKAAGPIRNAAMARYADALIAIWDGKSRGTQNMIEQARKYGLKIYVYTV